MPRPLIAVLLACALVAIARPAIAARDPRFSPAPWPDAALTLGRQGVVGPVGFMAGPARLARLEVPAGGKAPPFQAHGSFPGSLDDVRAAVAESTIMLRHAVVATARPAKGAPIALLDREDPASDAAATRTSATLDGRTLAGALARLAPGRYTLDVVFQARYDAHVDGGTWEGRRVVLAHGTLPVVVR